VEVRDVMTSPVISVRPETPFKTMIERLVESDVSGLPVLDESGGLVGIVTEADLVSKEAFTGHRRRPLSLFVDVFAAPRWLPKAFGWTASDVMTKDVVVCDPGEDVHVAARRMLEHGVKRMPVVQSGAVVGMFTRGDLLRMLARPDGEIAKDVVKVLSTNLNQPDDFHVDAEVENGVVTFTGDVRYQWDEPVVISLVRDVEGVIDVVSRIHNREPNPRSSGAFIGPR
jgi:CBS domain-containing protein